MTTQSVNQTQWGLAAVSGNWPGTPGPWPSNYGYEATGAGVPVYLAQPPIPSSLGTMIYNPYMGTLTDSHGAEMAAIVGHSVYGVAKGAVVLCAAAMDYAGNGSAASANAALDAILSHKQANYPGLAVCLMPFSNTGENLPNAFAARIDALKAAGVICVTSAGNDGISDMANSTFKVWPAMDPDCVTVTACSLDGGRHPQHNCGMHDIIAPGLDYATLDHNLVEVVRSGTSGAAAFVAGALACYIEAGFADPVAQMLADMDTTRAFDFPNGPQGILHKPAAMEAQVPAPPPPPPPSTSAGAVLGFEGTPAAMNFSGVAIVPFNKVIRGDWAQGSKMVVPAGFTEVKVGAMVLVNGVAVNSRVLFRIARNGVADWAEGPRKDFNVGASAIADANLVSGWLPVSEGETFEVSLYCSDPSVSLSSISTMWIEGR